MKKFLSTLLFAAAAAISLTGCYGTIETGNAGLRTNFNGTTDQKVEPEGFYTAVTGHVDQYTLKEVGVDLPNLQPKAKDNLSLRDLDVSIFYRVNSPQALRALAVKYTGQSVQPQGSSTYFPAYRLVESLGKSEAANAVSKHDSLTIHTQRTVLESEIKTALQASLNTSDPNSFTITKVVVRQILTDPTVEQSIRNVVAKGKELEAATLQVQVAEKNAEAVAKTANTLTPAFLQHEYNQALLKFAEKGGTVILDGSSSGKMINVGR
ncbi:SPFH domain-containing protein [Massilia sp. TN1-12]|uniref:SPFH domain-containing protein n=1 Tax=Massilia paldalensis TaxID=3377675 RepID=UPI00384AD200